MPTEAAQQASASRESKRFLGAVLVGCTVKSCTSLLSRRSRVDQDPDTIVASAAIWCVSYCILWLYELWNLFSLRRREHSEGGGTGPIGGAVTPLEVCGLVLVAAVYSLQENLQFYVMEEVQAPVFQTLSNLKIVSVTAFSIVILGKKFSRRQYLSLLLLMAGSCLIRCSLAVVSFPRMMAILTIVCCSGINLVLYEKIVCKKQTSVHKYNIVFYSFSVLLHGSLAAVSPVGLWGNLVRFNLTTAAAAFVQVLNGTANTWLVLNAGAVGKQVIAQGAVVIVTLMSWLSKSDKFHLTPGYLLGCTCVMLSVWFYKYPLPTWCHHLMGASKAFVSSHEIGAKTKQK